MQTTRGNRPETEIDIVTQAKAASVQARQAWLQLYKEQGCMEHSAKRQAMIEARIKYQDELIHSIYLELEELKTRYSSINPLA